MKTPVRRQASTGAGEQLHLIEPPPFCPTTPKSSTLAADALKKLLRGDSITHQDFIRTRGSWRLAEFIRALRHDHGWPVQTVNIAAPTKHNPSRTIARYELPRWVLEQLESCNG